MRRERTSSYMVSHSLSSARELKARDDSSTCLWVTKVNWLIPTGFYYLLTALVYNCLCVFITCPVSIGFIDLVSLLSD